MTFTRASTAWCSKTGEASSISNGDLVECANNQPRVMPGGDGSGGNGLGVWSARTNTLLRSAELENAAWSSISSGAAAPTVTANFATAPDGTTTAERLQFPATTLGQYSGWRQVSSCPIGLSSGGLYLKLNSGGPLTTNVCLGDATDFDCTADTTINSSTWTRVYRNNGPLDIVGGLYFGNISPSGTTSTTFGFAAQPAMDALAWGAHCESGVNLGPYITTVASAATRVAEVAYFATVPPFPVASIAATATTATGWVPTAGAFNALVDSDDNASKYFLAAAKAGVGTGCTTNSDTGVADSFVASALASGGRVACAVSGSGGTTTGFLNSVAASSASTGTLTTAHTQISIGGFARGTAHWLNGTAKNVCLDPNSTRCR